MGYRPYTVQCRMRSSLDLRTDSDGPPLQLELEAINSSGVSALSCPGCLPMLLLLLAVGEPCHRTRWSDTVYLETQRGQKDGMEW